MDGVDGMDEIVREFLAESREGLDQLDHDLLELERCPTADEPLTRAFRVLHTVKGTGGLLGFSHVEAVGHAAEQLLSLLRDRELVFSSEVAGVLLDTSDALRDMLLTIERTGAEPGGGRVQLLAALGRLGRPDAASPVPSGSDDTDRADVSPDPVEETAPPPDEARSAPVPALAETSIRVDVGLLDELMNLVGELVLARNRIVQLVAQPHDVDLGAAAARLNQVTGELQERVATTRMQPVGILWDRLPRLVRDLAGACGKQVRLEVSGADTGLDRSILEAIRDPLTHLVRNAVDHGIETPEEREAAGKPPEGRVSLRAYHDNGQVRIELADDGAGIELARLRDQAVARGLVDPDRAAALNEQEALQLIFAPGFSTADEVTSVSGRGVGMDVVKTNVERIGGAVDVATERGRGTVFTITIPLTLAIVPALVVRAGNGRYVIPQVAVSQLARLDAGATGHGVESVNGIPVYRFRGRLVPVVDLAETLGGGDGQAGGSGADTLIVLYADGEQFGLVVDGVEDTQEIVVKPLGREVRGIPLFAGATIMGDGRVALILDVPGLARHARALSSQHEHGRISQPAPESPLTRERDDLLVVALSDTRRAAIPLAAVSRIEVLSPSKVEDSSAGRVVQSRGRILPLLDLAAAVGAGAVAGDGMLNVVVVEGPQGSVGLLVGGILDVAEEDVVLDGTEGRRGLAGAAVVQGRVTDVVDLEGLLGAGQRPAVAGRG